MPDIIRHNYNEPVDERVGNEKKFRKYNDWLKANLETLFSRHDEDFQIHFVCECSDLECQQRIDLTLTEYERLRSMERCFVLIKGHEQPDIEQAIGSNGVFHIVQKGGVFA